MPIYSPRNTATKKNQILEYKIFEFLKCIETEQSKEKVGKKSELVRTSMLKLIKARLSLIKLYKADDKNKVSVKLQEKLNADTKNWKSFTFDEIKEFCIKQKRD